ncbi:SDR family NAD(P)-dependent oxidoreductase [uncultured Microbulbifer sp.]|uniref:SDR family NAD(P)-dependent oxidoreductase n=1 Tax=uncultured Microbulbifer sp. TaxID=348147 RepID=UPI00261D3851|nr:SDR family NAD(P)-dependent oxidoreductase [uncultured Microbulbifer sp.]
MSFELNPTIPRSGRISRILACTLGQKRKNRICPAHPRLDGKRALVTGGAAGVGEFVSRGLMERGAQVTTMARGLSHGSGILPEADTLMVDLGDPLSIVSAIDCLGDTPFDLVICNAGLLPKKAEKTVMGLEKTFAVNVLGHHILYRLLIERNLLTRNARIVMTTGDIYILAKACSADIPYDSANKVYVRSKLGNLWQVAELKRRYPNLHPIAVHPGVVASGFIGSKTGFIAWLRSVQLISEEAGAQASLIGATQDLPRGTYWHNTIGVVALQAGDPALDPNGASCLWGQLESLTAPLLK